MSGDVNYPSVTLLLHCDGTDGSTTFTDSSPTPKTVTANGNAHVEVDQYKFGTASAAFDGSGDYLSIADSTDMRFGSGDFTIEAWVRFASGSAGYGIIDRRAALTARGLGLNINNGTFVLRAGDTSTTAWEVEISSTSKSINTWYHVAATRSGTTYRLFVDGVKEGETTWAGTVADDTSATLIGRIYNSLDFSGYIDEIRITKGVARYTADFTAPAAAFPDYAGQIAGTVLDDAGDPAARIVRAYRRDSGALVTSTTSSAGDGSYTLNCPTLDECTVICLDDAAGDDYNDLVFRVTPA